MGGGDRKKNREKGKDRKEKGEKKKKRGGGVKKEIGRNEKRERKREKRKEGSCHGPRSEFRCRSPNHLGLGLG